VLWFLTKQAQGLNTTTSTTTTTTNNNNNNNGEKLIPKEQKGCRRGTKGCKDQLLISKAI
jgi:hypothetical protein